MASKKKFVKLTIPEADARVLKWMDSQDSVSVSVRVLIHREVAAHGYRDALCTDETEEKAAPAATSEKTDEVSGTEIKNITEEPSAQPAGTNAVHPETIQERPSFEQAEKDTGHDDFHTEDGDLDMDKIFGHS